MERTNEVGQDPHDAPGQGRVGGVDDPVDRSEYGDTEPEEYAVDEHVSGEHVDTVLAENFQDAVVVATSQNETDATKFRVTHMQTGHDDIVVHEEPAELGTLHPPATDEEMEEVERVLEQYMDGLGIDHTVTATAQVAVEVPLTETSTEQADRLVRQTLEQLGVSVVDLSVTEIEAPKSTDVGEKEVTVPDRGDIVTFEYREDGQTHTSRGEVIRVRMLGDIPEVQVNVNGQQVVTDATAISDVERPDDKETPDHEVFN